MQNPDAVKVAQLLDEYGRRTALYGGNPYRAKAYLRAAENVALLARSLSDDLIRENRRKASPRCWRRYRRHHQDIASNRESIRGSKRCVRIFQSVC